MKSFVALLALVAVVSCQKFGPKGTIIEFDTVDCYTGNIAFVSDKNNLCWYWECKQDKLGIYSLIPRRCALGSKMRSSYISGKDNPCQINFNKEIDFECTRTDDDDPTKVGEIVPGCFKELSCKNNGTANYVGNICWCKCLPEWQGANDCSLPTEIVSTNTTGGEDSENCFTDKKPCDLAKGCDNGGVCHNQCKDFWCDCPVPFTRGKRCESFDCETNACQNGGTCNRGENDQDEVNSCQCSEDYEGLLCEKKVGNIEFEEEEMDVTDTDESADPVDPVEQMVNTALAANETTTTEDA